MDGRAYAIPNIFTTYRSNSVMYREDLRKKYDLEPLTDLESIGAYLQAIKDNEPGMLPSDDNSNGFFRRLFLPSTVYRQVDDINGNCNFVIDPANPRKVYTDVYKRQGMHCSITIPLSYVIPCSADPPMEFRVRFQRRSISRRC